MDQAVGQLATASENSTLKGLADQLRVIAGGNAPTDNTPAIQIHHRGQIAPAILHLQVSRVGNPSLIAAIGATVFPQQVRAVTEVVLAVGADRLESLLLPSFNAQFLH